MVEFGHNQPHVQQKDVMTNIQQERAERGIHNLNSESLIGVGGDVRDVRNAFGGNINMGKCICQEKISN